MEESKEIKLLNKIRIVYQGDVFTAYIYFGFGIFFAFVSVVLYYLTHRLGFFYLLLGLSLFALYGIGKGYYLRRLSLRRYHHFLNKTELSETEFSDEVAYNRFRLEKKARNRRRYIYVMVIMTTTAIIGIFLQEKGLIMGTSIPIVLYSAVEFSIGLMVEFRLWEYQRILEKYQP